VLALPEVLRDGKTLELQLEKLNPQVALVPVHLFNSKHQVASSWEDVGGIMGGSGLPSGKRLQKTMARFTIFICKSTIFMVMFNSYVELPEGKSHK
jgi:hypothetical protein